MPKTLRKLQLLQLEILRDIDLVCRENDITYYLTYGTLLGAVRHGGFIPWDDDVDIAMYRDDYDRFFHVMSKYNPDKYFVQNFETDPQYSRYILKVRLNGTQQIEREVSTRDMHHGVFVDVFPLDDVSKKEGLELVFRGIVLKYLALCQRFSVQDHFRYSGNAKKKPFAYLIYLSSKLISSRKINRLYNYFCTKSNGKSAPYRTSFSSGGYTWKREIVPHEVYGKGTRLKFEGSYFNAPSDWHRLLTAIYGDYRTPPPEDARKGHDLTQIDFGIYDEILNSKIMEEEAFDLK